MSRASGGVVVLAALKPEIVPLRRRLEAAADVRLFKMGVGPLRAERAARLHIGGADLVLTAGCCGGLAPGADTGMILIPGTLLMAREGAAPLRCPDPDDGWAARARQQAERMGLHCSDRPLITVHDSLNSPESKQRCHEQTGAVGVDMETAVVAQVAGELGVPHLAMRVVLDSVEDQLPEQHISDGEGRIRARKLARAMLKPRSLLSLAAMAVRLRSISETLAGVVEAVLAE